jgi:hypothetical protein
LNVSCTIIFSFSPHHLSSSPLRGVPFNLLPFLFPSFSVNVMTLTLAPSGSEGVTAMDTAVIVSGGRVAGRKFACKPRLEPFKNIFTNGLTIMVLYIEIQMAPQTAVKIRFAF